MFARRLVIADGSVEVTREVDGGMQTISQKRPAITTTDLRPDDLRYPSLPNIMNKKKPIYAKTPTDLGVDVAPRDLAARSQYEPGRPRGFDHATRTNCARSSSVIRLSDLTAIATSVARREPWRVLRASSITLLVAFCSGTSPPRILSAFCGQTPSANSFAPARWWRGYTYSRRSRRVQPSFSSHPPASQIFRRRPHFPSCANAKRSISGPSAVAR